MAISPRLFSTSARSSQPTSKARKNVLTKKGPKNGKATAATLKQQLLGEVRTLRGTARTSEKTIAHLKKKLAALLAEKKAPKKTLIPRPEGKFDLRAVLAKADISRPKYRAIRRDLRAFVMMCRLNDKKTWHAQDPNNVGSLFTKMNKVHPELKRFAGNWPSKYMAVQYLQNRRRPPRGGRKADDADDIDKNVFEGAGGEDDDEDSEGSDDDGEHKEGPNVEEEEEADDDDDD